MANSNAVHVCSTIQEETHWLLLKLCPSWQLSVVSFHVNV